MRTFKAMFAALAVIGLLAAFTLPASAQIPTFGYTGSSAFTVTNGTANPIAMVIDVSKQASVGVMLSVSPSAGDAANVDFSFTRSVDGSTYDTVSQNVRIATAAVGKASVLTNLQSYGAQFIKLNYVTNSAATAVMTNCVVTYATKISTP